MYHVINRRDDSRYPFAVYQGEDCNEACCAAAGIVRGNEYHNKICIGCYDSEADAEAACADANDCDLA